MPEWLEGLSREAKKDNYSKRNYGGGRRWVDLLNINFLSYRFFRPGGFGARDHRTPAQIRNSRGGGGGNRSGSSTGGYNGGAGGNMWGNDHQSGGGGGYDRFQQPAASGNNNRQADQSWWDSTSWKEN